MMQKIIRACLNFGTRYYTISQVVDATGLKRSAVRHRLWKLEADGLLIRVNCRKIPLPGFSRGKPMKEICYRNVKLQPLREKTKAPRPVKENGWDKMWKAVRALRRFTRNDLAIICQQSIHNVRYFTKAYRKLGYVRPLSERGRNVVWLLIKDAGPKRPFEGAHK
jgi:DNA-binding Lrp family transcriptional regulator